MKVRRTIYSKLAPQHDTATTMPDSYTALSGLKASQFVLQAYFQSVQANSSTFLSSSYNIIDEEISMICRF